MRIRGQTIVDAVASHYGLTPEMLRGGSRFMRVARPRQVAMYLIRKQCPHLSLPQIGAILGGRDHTTILHGCRKVAVLIQSDTKLLEDVQAITRAVQPGFEASLWQVRIIEARRHLDALCEARAADAMRVAL